MIARSFSLKKGKIRGVVMTKEFKSDDPALAGLPMLVTQKTASEVTGVPYSTMRKAFMTNGVRPSYIPFPPPHTYFGRSVRIYSDKLQDWARKLGDMRGVKKRGRPTDRNHKASNGGGDV